MGLFKPNVAKLLERGNTGGLVTALGAKDRSIGLAARDALIRIGDSAVPDIAAVFQQADLPGRDLAVEALAAIGGDRGVAGLKAALETPDGETRLAAVRGLDEVGSAPAAEALLAALGDPDPSVGRAVIDSLIRIGSPILHQIRETISPSTGPVSATKNGRPVEMAAVLVPPDLVRIRTSAILANLIAPDSRDTLLQLLDDTNLTVRFNAVSGLAHLRDKRAVDGLFRALEDSAPDVRAHAERSLLQMEHSAISEGLLRSQLESGDRAARSCADRLLRKKGIRLGRCAGCGALADVDTASFSEHREDPREMDEAYGVVSVLVRTRVCPDCGSALTGPVTAERLEERTFLYE